MKSHLIQLSIIAVVMIVLGILFRNGITWTGWLFIPLSIYALIVVAHAHMKGVM